jgi:hypothetical protein
MLAPITIAGFFVDIARSLTQLHSFFSGMQFSCPACGPDAQRMPYDLNFCKFPFSPLFVANQIAGLRAKLRREYAEAIPI